MRAAANSLAQYCEAEFYSGEWWLLRGDARDAGAAFKAAARTCAKFSSKYAAVLAELKWLKQQMAIHKVSWSR
jgi:hypothetical protein